MSTRPSMLFTSLKLGGIVTLTLGLGACVDNLFNVPAFEACPATLGGDLALHTPGASSGDLAWPSWGKNLANTHHAVGETSISPANVATLETKWIYTTTGSVSATPTITDNALYVTDWGPGTSLASNWPGGAVHAINKTDGTPLWTRSMQSLNGDRMNHISRSTPAIFEDLIIIGDVQNPAPITSSPSLIDRARRFLAGFGDLCGGYLYALKRDTGELVWSRQIGQRIYDQISQSPVVYNDTVFVGVSSHESTYTRSAKVPCCDFKGSFVAVDAHTGTIQWETPMIDPSYTGFAGAAVWAGAPTIDPARNAVYVPTGNNYRLSSSAQSCIAAAANEAAINACLAPYPNNYFDAIVSLDMTTGAVNWVMKSQAYDAWTTACDYEHLFPLLAVTSSRKNCPTPKGPDSDFAQPPMLQSVEIAPGVFEDRLFAGNKAGEFFAINPDTGAIIWRRQVGPSGLIGGMQFGAATDGQRLYIQNSNFNHVPYTLEAGSLSGTTIRTGFWAALNPVDGSLIWQTPVPDYTAPIEGGGLDITSNAILDDTGFGFSFNLNFSTGDFNILWGTGLADGFYNWPVGGLTVANGVVFAGVSNLQGTMVAMDATNGTILWRFDSYQSIASTPAVVDGRVYWGSGYKYGNQGDRVYSFGLP